MDKSAEYIKMCDCEEIQKNWKPKNGDFIQIYSVGGAIIETSMVINEWMFNKSEAHTWLPRQDQLQEMVRSKFEGHGLEGFIYAFHHFVEDNEYMEDANTKRFTSMEQLWLAFVMHELYQMKWSGTEWI